MSNDEPLFPFARNEPGQPDSWAIECDCPRCGEPLLIAASKERGIEVLARKDIPPESDEDDEEE
jgi:hypothetical protein